MNTLDRITAPQIQVLHAAMVDAGFDAKIWKESRIYINGEGRDIKAYITFDEPMSALGDEETPLFFGCSLKVFSDCAQDRVWLVNRAKQVKHGLMGRLHDAGIVTTTPCERWQDVIL